MPHLVVKGAIFTGTQYLESGIVIIDESTGLITGVGERGALDEPTNSRVVSHENATILPGLIDAHIHLFGGKKYDLLEWVTTNETLVALRCVSDLRRLLLAGFTTIRDLGGKVGIQLSQAVNEGVINGPDIISCGRSIAQTGGNDDPNMLPIDIAQRISYSYYCDGPWESRRAVRKVVRDGGTVIKVYASGSLAQGGKTRRQFTVEELKAIVDEAHSVGLKVSAHAYGEDAIANTIEAGVDSIEH